MRSAYLKEHLIHHHYETIAQFVKKIHIYAPNEAEEYLEKAINFLILMLIRFPLNDFLARFFARKGYKDGFHGLMLRF